MPKIPQQLAIWSVDKVNTALGGQQICDVRSHPHRPTRMKMKSLKTPLSFSASQSQRPFMAVDG